MTADGEPPRTAYEPLVQLALAEDLGTGDVTSRAIVPAGARGRGRLAAREPLVAAGLFVAARCFEAVGPGVSFEAVLGEGDRAVPGDVLAWAEGPLRDILSAERTALNFLQRSCGIATATRRLVDLVADTGVLLLDTRKTLPGFRALDKHAVRMGGGTSHRAGLDDMVLVKDNHLVAAGSLEVAVERALRAAGPALKVEVEVDGLEQLDRLLALPRLPDAVLLDNFSPGEVAEGVRRVGGRLHVEVSGGVTEETLRAFADAGPDAISLGALTHSVRAADIGLDLELVSG